MGKLAKRPRSTGPWMMEMCGMRAKGRNKMRLMIPQYVYTLLLHTAFQLSRPYHL